MLEAVGIPVLGAEAFEADDVIATVVDRATEGEGVRVRIVSKDKDLQQLLSAGRVEMYDVHTDDLIDAGRLLEDKGVSPGQVIDMLALMGDTVDNVPGVPGIGPKTAAQLIAEYGSMEAVLAEASKEKSAIKGKRRENLLATADALPLSKELVTLRHDAPVELALERAAVSSFDLAALGPILKELGFNRYQDELRALLGGAAGGPDAGEGPGGGAGGFGGLFDGVGGAAAVSEIAGQYECVTTKKALDGLVRRLKKADLIAIDTETTSTRATRADLCGLSFSVEVGKGWYVPVRSPEPSSHLDAEAVLGALGPIIEDADRPKCGHNLKYDLLVLRRAGVELRGIAFDSMIASYLIDASRSSHSMDALAQALLGYQCVSIKELIGSGKSQRTFDQVPLEQAAPYAAEDADISLRLRDEMAPRLAAMGLGGLFADVETPLLSVLAELEWNGIRVDGAELERQAARLGGRIDELRERIVDAAPRDFNPDSPKQLATILFNKPDDEEPGLGLKPGKRTKTGYSTDVEVLEKLAGDPAVETTIPADVLEYRRLTKLVGTYLTALKEEISPETGRVHASFNQTVAATGRLSSSDPNLQNIPIRTDIGREIRRAFVADGGGSSIG
jgi:DNA polymerase-1